MSSPARAKASWRLFGLDGGMHGTWEDYIEERPRRGFVEFGLPPPISQNLPLLIEPPTIYTLPVV